jgi:NAD(P)-dependent dehydrogenase (short-subunit alcohol dehydrogenase family)
MTGIGYFGKTIPLDRCGQPSEVAPAYVYLAEENASYRTGQILHINGGIVVGG